VDTDLELLKRNVSNAEIVVVSKARQLCGGAVRDGRYSVIVKPHDLTDLQTALRRLDEATAAFTNAYMLKIMVKEQGQ